MKVLTLSEIQIVSGGESGTLERPIPKPESERGKELNDVCKMLHDFGTFLGGKVYDWTHPVATR